MSVFSKKKSDDSILEDAQKAREREQAGKVAPEDNLEHTYEEVADAPVKAKMAGASEDRVKQLENELAEVRKMLGTVQNTQLVSTAKMAELKQRELKRAEIPQCNVCGQYATVCAMPDKKGNHHVTLKVLPQRPEHQPDFPGVIWNNVVYCGMAVVPAICADDIASSVKTWEEYKFNLHLNRGRTIGKNRAITEGIPRGGYPLFGT